MEHNNAARIQVLGRDGRAGGRTKAQGDIGHAEHHHTLVLRRVLGDTAQVRLDDVVPVQEWQLACGLDPDLV